MKKIVTNFSSLNTVHPSAAYVLPQISLIPFPPLPIRVHLLTIWYQSVDLWSLIPFTTPVV
jgi:hypothetical protein